MSNGGNKSDKESHQMPKKEASRSDHSIYSLLSNISISQDENFRMPKYAENSLRVMETYLKNQELTDIVLIAGGKRIPAHRIVLSAGSEYFAAMFRNSLLESTQNEIELKEIDGEALCALVQYCYSGCIAIREDNVETLLSAACLLQLASVINACCHFLMKELHPSNCLGIRMFADTQGCANLLQAAQNYTSDHFMEVIKHQEFLSLSTKEIEKLLESEDLNVPSEETIFHALLSWLQHEPDNRKKDAGRLLALVKLPLLSPAFISDNIENNEMFVDQKSCRDLVIEALKYHLLPERRSMLQSSRTRPRKSTVGKVLIVGGMDTNKGSPTIDMFSLRDNSWHYIADINGARRIQFGAAIIDKKLVVAGGRDGLKTLNTVEYFDLVTKQWNSLPTLSVPRHGLGIAVLGGPLYAVGGHDGWGFLNSVERWDPSTRTWSYVSSMSTQRSTVGVAVLDNKLYAVGGRDISSCLNTVECYDPHTDKWTLCAPMSKSRGGVGVGVLNGYLYALGGHDAPISNPNASRFNCVERYDPKTDSWKLVAPMSVARDSVGVCTLGDRLIAVGGYDGQQYLSLAEIYDPHLDKWEQVAPLVTGRAGPCVAIKR